MSQNDPGRAKTTRKKPKRDKRRPKTSQNNP